MTTKLFHRTVIPALLTAAVVGCGGGVPKEELPRAPVEGTVTLDGKELKEGVIRFVPSEGTEGPKVSVVIDNGKFSATAEHGPIVGSHRIEIESTDDGGYARDDEQAIDRLKAAGSRRIDLVRVPAVYNVRSTLDAVVTADGPNEYTFPLSNNPGRNR